MVKLRLVRMGTKHKPFFRIVAIDSHKKQGGAAIEKLGFYDPKTKPATLKINHKRFEHWVKNGAQVTASLRKLLKNEKTA